MAENKWIEVISLRFSGLDAPQVILDIFGQVRHGIKGSPKDLKLAELYVNTTLETDWSIYLHWEDHQDRHPSKTVLGLNIAERFRSLGLVNHSVWQKKIIKDEINHKQS